MTDGVDTAMEPVQPPAAQPVLYRGPGDPQFLQLLMADDAVLLRGELRDLRMT